MSFDLLNYLNCLIEAGCLLLMWKIADFHPFEKWNYLLSYILLCGISIPVTFIDSVFFSILPVNFLLIMLCMWVGFRRSFKETLLYTLFQYLLLLYLQSIVNCLIPEKLFLTQLGNFLANGFVLAITIALVIIGNHYHFAEMFQQNAGKIWALLLVLCVPEIVLVQIIVSMKNSPSALIGIILLLLQFLYLVTVIMWFSISGQRNERRKLADTEKYINEMNSHLEESRRSMHDFNKHIRYLRNTVAVNSKDEELVHRVDDYCESMLGTYEKEELLLQLDDPVLRAILYGRQSQATANHIDYILDATPVLPQFPLKSYQIVEVFDNLINNAFECVMELPEDNRWIRITLSAKPQSDSNGVEHMLSIENPAPNVDLAAIVSEKAYTSKGGKHQGIGLRHVSQLVSHSGGSLVVSHRNGVFKVKVAYILTAVV